MILLLPILIWFSYFNITKKVDYLRRDVFSYPYSFIIPYPYLPIMFTTNTILVSATVFKEYADGTVEKEHVRYAFDVPEYAIKDSSKLQKTGLSNLLDVVGRDHEVLGVISYTDDAGRKHEVKFNHRPAHTKKLTPKGYQTKPAKKDSGDKLKKGLSAVSKAFDKLMGEEPKKKSTQTHKKRNTATKKAKTTKKSTGKKTASKCRKTTKR